MKHTRPLIFALTLAIVGFSTPLMASESITPRAVVELYTSEGCSSCPPADRVLYELNQERSDLLVLSYHVDYWNYLGWTDPFSDSMFSERQREYAQHMRERYVYTPQAIINGEHVVRATQKQRIGDTSNSAEPLHDVATLLVENHDEQRPATGTIILQSLSTSERTSSLKLWLVGFDREHARDVRSGENAGKRLVHANVVREMIDLGTWNGSADERTFAMKTAGDGGVALLVQQGRGGPIIAASMVRY